MALFPRKADFCSNTPNTHGKERPLEMTLRQLRKVAVNVQSRYSRMRKSQLLAIQQVQQKFLLFHLVHSRGRSKWKQQN